MIKRQHPPLNYVNGKKNYGARFFFACLMAAQMRMVREIGVSGVDHSKQGQARTHQTFTNLATEALMAMQLYTMSTSFVDLLHALLYVAR